MIGEIISETFKGRILDQGNEETKRLKGKRAIVFGSLKEDVSSETIRHRPFKLTRFNNHFPWIVQVELT